MVDLERTIAYIAAIGCTEQGLHSAVDHCLKQLPETMWIKTPLSKSLMLFPNMK